ncbi:unnamed protein product [Meganyctiphanes norvegica]|uniref:Uncharacterized protein n=1 Tax=Meganyctiphanes norvegica TaxID=48144 RepID=A0AAV2PHE9_MEGNR
MSHLVFFLVIFAVLPWYISGKKCGDNGQCRFECHSGEKTTSGACFRIHRCCEPTATENPQTDLHDSELVFNDPDYVSETVLGDPDVPNGRLAAAMNDGVYGIETYKSILNTLFQQHVKEMLVEPSVKESLLSKIEEQETTPILHKPRTYEKAYDDVHNGSGKEVFEDLTGSDSNPNYANETSNETLDNNSLRPSSRLAFMKPLLAVLQVVGPMILEALLGDSTG